MAFRTLFEHVRIVLRTIKHDKARVMVLWADGSGLVRYTRDQVALTRSATWVCNPPTGGFEVEALVLYRALQALSGEPTAVGLEGNQLVLRTGRETVRIEEGQRLQQATVKAFLQGFRSRLARVQEQGIVYAQTVLESACRVTFAADRDGTRPGLDMVHFVDWDGRRWALASDGYQVALTPAEDAPETALPADLVPALHRLTQESDVEVRLWEEPSNAGFREKWNLLVGDTLIALPAPDEGTFNWGGILNRYRPNDTWVRIEIPRSSLQDVVQRGVKTRAHSLGLLPGQGKVVLNGSGWSLDTTLQAQVVGGEARAQVWFQPNLLWKALKASAQGERVTLWINPRQEKPAWMQVAGDDLRHLIMPLSTTWDREEEQDQT